MVNQEKIRELDRYRLAADLEAILQKRLMIIAAPSGYGKTMLAKDFTGRHKELKTAWLSLGLEAVDDVWVWNKICLQFKENEEVYRELREMGLPKTTRELDSFAGIVREAIRCPVFFIFDDYHSCNSVWINRLLVRTVYEDIENLHILIISRTYPDMPYEELMLKGYCTVIDQQLLTLSRAEVEEVFSCNGAVLSRELMDEIYRYTDGWISAVYLILFDYKRTGRLRLSLGVMHLMKNAIFDKLPGQIRELFMGMSLFDSFTAAEASYVMRREISEAELDGAVEQFGFVQYDIVGRRYEMHDLLRQTAAAELDKSGLDKKELCARYAQWRRRAGDLIPAVVYYRRAGETEEIFRLLEEKSRQGIFEEAPAVMEEFFNETDENECLRHPAAYLSYLYFQIFRNRGEEGRQRFERAKRWYRENCSGQEDYAKLLGEIYIVESLLEYNDLEKVNGCLRKARELLDGSSSQIFSNAILTYGTPQTLILRHKHTGDLIRVVQQEKEYARLYMQLFNGAAGGWDELFDAEYNFSRGCLKEAEALARIVVEKAKFSRQICVLVSGYNILLRTAAAEGGKEAFERLMEEMKGLMQGIGRPALTIDYELAAGYAFCCTGQPDKTAEWLKQFKLEECSYVVRSTRNGCIVHGAWLREEKRWATLDAVAEQMLTPYEKEAYLYVVIYAYIYKAEAKKHLENKDAAAQILRKGLILAEPDGIKMPFMENYMELLPLLESLQGESEYAGQLLPYCRSYEKGNAAFRGKKSRELLTSRELELMEYVKAGMRNSEISSVMSIALVTVEKNLTNVYRKLNVSNRLAAIAKLRELEKE